MAGGAGGVRALKAVVPAEPERLVDLRGGGVGAVGGAQLETAFAPGAKVAGAQDDARNRTSGDVNVFFEVGEGTKG